MDSGEILTSAFKYPMNLRLFSILFLVKFFLLLPFCFLQTSGIIAISLIQLLPYIMPLIIATFFIGIFFQAFYIDNAAHYFLKYKYKEINKSCERAVNRYFPLLLTNILLGLIIVLIFLLVGSFTILIFNSLIIFLFSGMIGAIITAFFLLFASYTVLLKAKNL